MTHVGSGLNRADILAELHRFRGRISHIQGSIVATTDGMVVVHDLGETETFGIESDAVAAVSAVNLGLSQRIADTASHGALRETVIRGSFGQVITCAAGERALLMVLVGTAEEIIGLNHEARRVAERISTMILDMGRDTPRDDAARWQPMPDPSSTLPTGRAPSM